MTSTFKRQYFILWKLKFETVDNEAIDCNWAPFYDIDVVLSFVMKAYFDRS